MRAQAHCRSRDTRALMGSGWPPAQLPWQDGMQRPSPEAMHVAAARTLGSIPVTVLLVGSLRPTMSTSSPTLTTPGARYAPERGQERGVRLRGQTTCNMHQGAVGSSVGGRATGRWSTEEGPGLEIPTHAPIKLKGGTQGGTWA